MSISGGSKSAVDSKQLHTILKISLFRVTFPDTLLIELVFLENVPSNMVQKLALSHPLSNYV